MMRGRGLAGIAALVLVIGLGLWWRTRITETRDPTRAASRSESQPAQTISAAKLTPEARAKILRNAPEAHLADRLDAPDADIRADLAIVGTLLAAYRSSYPQNGNPVGDNRDLVRTFQGRNPNGIIFLSANHPALNANGELCDRWGTPFFFHAESGTRMEVRSAGPDRKLWTEDDVAITP